MQYRDVTFDILQEIFVSLWDRRDSLSVSVSLSGYLFASVRYQIIRHIKNSQLKENYFKDYIDFISSEDHSNEGHVLVNDLNEAIERNLSGLPARCQEIYRLSRQHNKSIKEIAQEFNISTRTVENQLTIALKHLRKSLGDFLMALIIILCTR